MGDAALSLLTVPFHFTHWLWSPLRVEANESDWLSYPLCEVGAQVEVRVMGGGGEGGEGGGEGGEGGDSALSGSGGAKGGAEAAVVLTEEGGHTGGRPPRILQRCRQSTDRTVHPRSLRHQTTQTAQSTLIGHHIHPT